MEGSTGPDTELIDVLERHEADETEIPVPEGIDLAEDGKPVEADQEMDATEWLLSSDGPSAEEIAPTRLRINVGSATEQRYIEWHIVPLPDSEFKKLQRSSFGNRQTRRRVAQGDVTAVDQSKYNRKVVAAATVYPDLKEQAARKGVDVIDLLDHRFAAKPLLLSQIAGYVSDISGGDEADVEVVAGN